RPDDWSGLGLKIGKPATFTMTVTGAERFDQQKQQTVKLPVRGTGIIGLAVGQRVSFDEYPKPPRPATLKPLEDVGHNGYGEQEGRTAIVNSPANPAAPIS